MYIFYIFQLLDEGMRTFSVHMNLLTLLRTRHPSLFQNVSIQALNRAKCTSIRTLFKGLSIHVSNRECSVSCVFHCSTTVSMFFRLLTSISVTKCSPYWDPSTVAVMVPSSQLVLTRSSFCTCPWSAMARRRRSHQIEVKIKRERDEYEVKSGEGVDVPCNSRSLGTLSYGRGFAWDGFSFNRSLMDMWAWWWREERRLVFKIDGLLGPQGSHNKWSVGWAWDCLSCWFRSLH